MSKLNVNAATREDLVDVAGLRPEIADAILGFRGKHGGKISDVETLGELPGVGPATLDQLRATLDISDKGQKAGNGSDKSAQDGERSARETTERTADVAATAARGGVKVAASAASAGAETAREAVDAGARATSTAARGGLQLVEGTIGAVGEAQRETMRQSAEGTAELGRLFAEFVSEQTRHNLEVATAFGRAFDWGEVLQAQGEFVRESLERVTRLNGRYLEIVQSVMRATASAGEDRPRKAA